MTDGRHVLLASTRYDWQTPPWFLDLVREVAAIGFDPCTTPDNPTRARQFLTQQLEEVDGWLYSKSCGLLDEWPALALDELAFVNPPYGPHLSGDVDPHLEHWRDGERVGFGAGWARKIASYESGNACALVPVRTETEWWRVLYGWATCACLWSSREHGSRINFVDANTGEVVRGSNLASTVFFRGLDERSTRRFREVFGEHGTLIP